MTSIPILLSTGHRLFNALLMEAQAAMAQGKWADTQACLAEVATRLETHMHAEETVLFPRLAGQGRVEQSMLAQYRREHEDIRSQLRTTVAAAEACDRARCDVLTAHLRQALSRHCRSEEESLYPVTDAMNEDALGALARALSGAGDEGKPGENIFP
ncbi:MAG TPA: hemerythrin domain-containing protein [Gammaproteobacteria bacterium]|nr:hemerythrin domain-containing protein [Gammaproteobacteria bacterium]